MKINKEREREKERKKEKKRERKKEREKCLTLGIEILSLSLLPQFN
jgi:hypothetical protein